MESPVTSTGQDGHMAASAGRTIAKATGPRRVSPNRRLTYETRVTNGLRQLMDRLYNDESRPWFPKCVKGVVLTEWHDDIDCSGLLDLLYSRDWSQTPTSTGTMPVSYIHCPAALDSVTNRW